MLVGVTFAMSGCSEQGSSENADSNVSVEIESYRIEACAQIRTYATQGFPTAYTNEAIDLLLSAAQRFEVAGDFEASRAIQDRAVPAMQSGMVGQLEVPNILRAIFDASC
jgi:hypothetical protein